MSSAKPFSIVVDASNVGKPKKVSIQVTPNTLLSTIRQEACNQLQIENSASLSLYSPVSRKQLDLSLPVRLANLTPNSKLELMNNRKYSFPSPPTTTTTTTNNNNNIITVAVQVRKELAHRWVVEASCQDTLQSIIERVQQKIISSSSDENKTLPKDPKAYPVVYYVHQPIRNLTTRLQDLGLVKGSVLLQLDWEYREEEEKESSEYLSQPVQRIEEKKKMESPMEQELTPPSSSKKELSPSSSTMNTCHVVEPTIQTSPKDVEEDIQKWFQSGRLRIYQPSNRNLDPSAVELPDSFYEFTLDDLHTWKAEQQEKRQPVFVSKRRAVVESPSHHQDIIVRVKLPDGIYIEASFDVQDTLGAVYQLLQLLLLLQTHIYLFTTPPPKRWMDKDMILSPYSPGISFYLGGVDRSASSTSLLHPLVLQHIETSPYEQVIEREEKKAQEMREEWNNTTTTSNEDSTIMENNNNSTLEKKNEGNRLKETTSSTKDRSSSIPSWLLKSFRKY